MKNECVELRMNLEDLGVIVKALQKIKAPSVTVEELTDLLETAYYNNEEGVMQDLSEDLF